MCVTMDAASNPASPGTSDVLIVVASFRQSLANYLFTSSHSFLSYGTRWQRTSPQKAQIIHTLAFPIRNTRKGKNRKTMPHALSPLGSDLPDVTATLDAGESSKDLTSVPAPSHPPISLSPPVLSQEPTTIKTRFLSSVPAKEPNLSCTEFDPHNIMTAWECDHDDAMPDHISNEEQSMLYLNPTQIHRMPIIPENSEYHDAHSNAMHFSNNYHLAYSTPLLSGHPISYNTGVDLTGLEQSYPPNAFQIEPTVVMDFPYSSMNGHNFPVRDDCEDFGSAFRHDEYADYGSPYDPDAVIRSSTPNGDQPYPPLDYRTDYDEGVTDREQPYAQLIYRALMAAPGHTMILRDIYEWFKNNTDKAADKETKGWQNSIRHNLSMNGVRYSQISNVPSSS